jgi:hypothetical protein
MAVVEWARGTFERYSEVVILKYNFKLPVCSHSALPLLPVGSSDVWVLVQGNEIPMYTGGLLKLQGDQ